MYNKKSCELFIEDVEDATVIECSPDISLMGNIIGWLMVDDLKMKEIGYIDCESFPPLSVIHKGIAIQPARVYQKDDLVLFLTDFIVPQQIVFDLTYSISQWMFQNNAKKFFTFSSVLTQAKTGNILGVANNEESMETLKKHNISPMMSGSLAGISGTMLKKLNMKNIPGVCILAETLNQYPDPRAAASVVDVLNNLLDVEINTSSLIKEAELIESRLKQLAEQVSQDNTSQMYIQ